MVPRGIVDGREPFAGMIVTQKDAVATRQCAPLPDAKRTHIQWQLLEGNQ
jgi:hypothetical protein